MLDVFFTVDVEIWCNGWNDIDKKFPESYQRYINGPTPQGDFGLPFQLKLLRDHGLHGTFFVEPLFSTRFGSQPLEEIVGIIRDGGQEVQLHLHTEWVDESIRPLIADTSKKRQHIFQYTLEEQTRLIEAGAALLKNAGAAKVNAFRAGSFGFNRDTLKALAANRIQFDSSYNPTMFGPASGVAPNVLLQEITECEGVIEYPMTVFADGLGAQRHVQLAACSFGELEALLWQALEKQRSYFMILSHNFELLSPSKTQPDKVVLKRFRRLCEFLERNRDSFRTRGFLELNPKPASVQPPPLKLNFFKSAPRVIEQVYRRKYQ